MVATTELLVIMGASPIDMLVEQKRYLEAEIRSHTRERWGKPTEKTMKS